MDKGFEKRPPGSRLVNTRSVFFISLFVMVLTILAVWLLGLGSHRALFVNSLLSVSILSAAFLLFVVSGLYRGIKLKDNLGRITDRFRARTVSELLRMADLPDGCGDVEGVLLWIMIGVVLVLLLWILGNFFWMLILIFVAMLYWIFFRALRLIFRKGPLCKGNLGRSLLYGFCYTILYNCWIYGIIMAAHFLIP